MFKRGMSTNYKRKYISLNLWISTLNEIKFQFEEKTSNDFQFSGWMFVYCVFIKS